MQRWLGMTAVAALCALASPVLAQSASPAQNYATPGPTNGQSVETQLQNDRAQIQQDKAAVSQDQMSGSSSTADRDKLNDAIEQQEHDRQADEPGVSEGKH